MRLVSELVRSALGTDLSPDDITLLARRPDEVVTRLEEAYAKDPPDYTLPDKGNDGRPWVVYGRESAESSQSAPIWRARAAVQTLIYSHEVAIEDPVAWYLRHPYADRQDPMRTLELLSAVAELAPLIDEGIVRCTQQRPYHQNHPLTSVYEAFAQLLYGPVYTGPSYESAAELLQLLDVRNQTHGGVDVARHPGNYWVFNALRTAWGRLAADTGLLSPTEAVVVVPDIAQVRTVDLIRIRESGAFSGWRERLAVARSAYEEALSAGASENVAEEGFRGEMSTAAGAVANELEGMSWRSLTIRGARDAGVGAAGVLPLLSWGWREYATGAVGIAGAEMTRAVFDTRRLREQAASLVTMRNHFDTFIL